MTRYAEWDDEAMNDCVDEAEPTTSDEWLDRIEAEARARRLAQEQRDRARLDAMNWTRLVMQLAEQGMRELGWRFIDAEDVRSQVGYKVEAFFLSQNRRLSAADIAKLDRASVEAFPALYAMQTLAFLPAAVVDEEQERAA